MVWGKRTLSLLSPYKDTIPITVGVGHPSAAAAKSLQSCLTLCDPIDGSTRLPHPWDSPGKNTGVGCHFLLQCMKVKSQSRALSHVRLVATPWIAAYQAPPSTGFSRQEYWSGVPLPSPGHPMTPTKPNYNLPKV